jgi:hypothetical protein
LRIRRLLKPPPLLAGGLLRPPPPHFGGGEEAFFVWFFVLPVGSQALAHHHCCCPSLAVGNMCSSGRRGREGVTEAQMENVLDELWTLQYKVPGAVCAFAGPVCAQQNWADGEQGTIAACPPCHHPPLPACLFASGSQLCLPACLTGFTHVAQLRFGRPSQAESFRSNAATCGVLRHCVESVCDEVLEVAVEVGGSGSSSPSSRSCMDLGT